MGRKSTAQPRPKLKVPPRGYGPIVDPNVNDVLSGRGGRINSHPGNVQFREIVMKHKREYLAKTTKKLEKAHIAAALVDQIRSMDPPGRFLKEDADTGYWYDIGDAKAIKKMGQALREDAPDIRNELSSDDDEKKKKSPSSPKTTKSSPKKASPKSSPQVAPTSHHIPPPELGGLETEQQDAQHPQWGTAVVSTSAPPKHYAPAVEQPFAQMPSAVYNVPQKLYRGVGKLTNAAIGYSQTAMDAVRPPEPTPSNNEAFGKPFYPPASSELSSGSTISALSGPNTNSLMGGTANNSLMGGTANSLTMNSTTTPMASSITPSIFSHPVDERTSLRLSQVVTGDAAFRDSGMTDLSVSIRSLGSSLSRSQSFPDLMATDNLSVTIDEDHEYNPSYQQQPQTMRVPRSLRGRTTSQSSARSIASLSFMSLNSTTSSRLSAMMWDDSTRSINSDLSNDLVALNLATEPRYP